MVEAAGIEPASINPSA